MTAPFRAAPHLAQLKDFQQRTVEHVTRRFYDDDNPTRRFLVADETGLGKSLVARGVIAEGVERLLRDDSVGRIDVVYVCSNADIAAQNLARLNVIGGERVELQTRLTMLAAHSHDLNSAPARFGKAVNLIAFTPGTSFDKGWRTGKAEERALLYCLLKPILDLRGARSTAAQRMLQGGVRDLDSFRWYIGRYDDVPLDAAIAMAFEHAIRAAGLTTQVEALIDELEGKRSLPEGLREEARRLTGELRTQLARASVHALEPDLIILDEFQRFRHLLNIEKGGEAAELAHHLFEWDQARTLLLSATPYKPFTLAEEDELGESHYEDFITTLSFLCSHDSVWLSQVQHLLADYRSRLLSAQPCDETTEQLRSLLLRFMCRTERPAIEGAQREVANTADAVTADDFAGYVGLRDLARAVDGQVHVEYWKSAPYFINFVEGYQVGERLKKQLKGGATADAVADALSRVTRLDRRRLERYQPIDMGNARLRSLAERTVQSGWWQLLWVPPSMPYMSPEGPYAEPFAERMTKQLVFSSWAATPTAIAGLLSYEAERLLAADSTRLTANTAAARRRLTTRLDYRVEDGRPGGMSTLALFWPHPALAGVTDPLRMARGVPDRLASGDEAQAWALAQLRRVAPGTPQSAGDEANPVDAFFAWPGALPEDLRDRDPQGLTDLMLTVDPSDETDADRQAVRLDAHVDEARQREGVAAPSPQLAGLAMHSPGNIAWRALARLVEPDDAIEDQDLWAWSAMLANALRSTFNRIEAQLLLDRLYPQIPYWQAVLSYCRAGNLQAALDEYLHHLRSNRPEALDAAALDSIVGEAVSTLSMRPSRYVAFDPDDPTDGIPLTSRFALRYGSTRGKEDDVRLPEVRSAFNSPFWPFVLTTTSVGQEGIDFHWWCHSVVHWNTPANPVDFEQREGRVNRFGGHAIRRNIAGAYREATMRSGERDPWKVVYDAAAAAHQEFGDFCPYWIFPGPHSVERHLLPFPLSKDSPRAASLKRDLMLYRLALGQPRQEDLLAAIQAAPGADSRAPLNLAPPPQGAESETELRTSFSAGG